MDAVATEMAPGDAWLSQGGGIDGGVVRLLASSHMCSRIASLTASAVSLGLWVWPAASV